ncbi:hypothetical protein Nepgr_024759 [Nepenthes gracilis]|uniref:Uncharacterized protein n=1 Tax=Nepenthes gracilis TaxID=150966 RepID=A0AAD3T5B9_NEPGR|nr:hypothetical protein Nepgr_024759 [Nepenthes gracilis]
MEAGATAALSSPSAFEDRTDSRGNQQQALYFSSSKNSSFQQISCLPVQPRTTQFVRAVQPPRVKIHPSRISNDQSKIKPKVQQPASATFIHPKFMNLSQQQSSASALTIPMLTGPYKDRAIHIRRPKTIQMPNKTKGLSARSAVQRTEHQHVLQEHRVSCCRQRKIKMSPLRIEFLSTPRLAHSPNRIQEYSLRQSIEGFQISTAVQSNPSKHTESKFTDQCRVEH